MFNFQVLMFAEKKADVDAIHEYLLLKGVEAVAIHGGKGKIVLLMSISGPLWFCSRPFILKDLWSWLQILVFNFLNRAQQLSYFFWWVGSNNWKLGMHAFTSGHTAIERVPKYDSLQDFMRKWLAWNHGEQYTVAMPPAIQQTHDPNASCYQFSLRFIQ